MVSALLVMKTETPKSVSFAVPSGAISTLFLHINMPTLRTIHGDHLPNSLCNLSVVAANEERPICLMLAEN